MRKRRIPIDIVRFLYKSIIYGQADLFAITWVRGSAAVLNNFEVHAFPLLRLTSNPDFLKYSVPPLMMIPMNNEKFDRIVVNQFLRLFWKGKRFIFFRHSSRS